MAGGNKKKAKAKAKGKTQDKGDVKGDTALDMVGESSAQQDSDVEQTTQRLESQLLSTPLPSTEVNERAFPVLDHEPQFGMDPQSEGMKSQPLKLVTHAVDYRKDFRAHRIVDKSADLSKHAPRPGFRTSNGGFAVLTNYFTMDISRPKYGKLHLYEVNGIDTAMTKAKKKMLVERMTHKSLLLDSSKEGDDQRFVTDEKKRIVAWSELAKRFQYQSPSMGQDVVKITVDNFNAKQPNRGAQPLELTLKYVKDLDHDPLNDFCSGRAAVDVDQDLVQAVNLLVSKAVKERAGDEVLAIGSNKVYLKSDYVDLVDYKVGVRGFSYGYQLGMGCSLLNVNPIMSFFHQPMLVSAYIHGRRDLQDHLKGVRVWVNLVRSKVDSCGGAYDTELDQPSRRIKTIAGFGDSADKQHAYNDGAQRYTVWEHMDYYYGGGTKGTSKSVCVNLGGTSPNEQWFLAEDLTILPYQIYRGQATPEMTSSMIKYACRSPDQNVHALIQDFLPRLGMNNSNPTYLEDESRGLSIYSEQVALPAHKAVISPIQYREQQTKQSYGSWDLVDQQFLNTSVAFTGKAFFLLSTRNQLDHERTSTYLRFFHEQYSHNGVNGLHEFAELNHSNYASVSKFDTDSLTTAVRSAQNADADLVVLILPAKNKSELKNYSTFKAIVDQVKGMKSLCLCEKKIMGCFGYKGRDWNGLPATMPVKHPFSNYVRNVSMKLNVRLGNQNHGVPEPLFKNAIPNFGGDQGLMILGADVVHPGPGSHEGTPSVAAVVGTIDQSLVSFRGSARHQEGRTEIIADMYSMARERLSAYKNANGNTMPSRILYYRDGIDAGGFSKVRQVEVADIRKAWDSLVAGTTAAETPVKITTVVVTKRHHTRFYPTEKGEKIPDQGKQTNGNCLPGTVVDSGVTMPYNFDFFLLSHNAIKGTARPAHYIVLENQIGFTANGIQDLTNLLCATYVRSTTAVSYVPAAYYADHLCERAKQYLRPLFDGERGFENVAHHLPLMWDRAKRSDGSGNPWHEKLDDTMFWM